MAVISPYDQIAWSQYTPLSQQEIMAPAMYMRERQDKLDEEYAAINDEAQKIAFIAENENDPVIKAQYDNYIANLTQQIDYLQEAGYNPNARKRMLKLRGQYQKELMPLTMAFQTRLQRQGAIDEMRAKDPSWIGNNARDIKLRDIIAGGMSMPEIKGVSGSMLTQEAAAMAASYKDKIKEGDPETLALFEDQFGPSYHRIIDRFGEDPNSEEGKRITEFITNTLRGKYGVDDWANKEQSDAINNSILQGAIHMRGKDNISYQKDVTRDYNEQVALLTEKNKIEAEKEAKKLNTDVSRFPRSSFGSVKTRYDSNFDTKEEMDEWFKNLTFKDGEMQYINPPVHTQVKQRNTSGDDTSFLSYWGEGYEYGTNPVKNKRNDSDANMIYWNQEYKPGEYDTKYETVKNRKKYANDMYKKYSHLDKDPKEALRKGLAIERTTYLDSFSAADIGEAKDSRAYQIITDEAISGANKNRQSYGFFPLDDNFTPAKKSITGDDIATLVKDKGVSYKMSPNGLIAVGSDGKEYAVKTRLNAENASSALMKKSNKYVKDFSKDGYKTAQKVNKLEDIDITKAETIHNDATIGIYGVNAYVGGTPTKILFVKENGNLIGEFIFDVDDVSNYGGEIIDGILQNLTTISINKLVGTTYLNTVPSRTEVANSTPVYGEKK